MDINRIKEDLSICYLGTIAAINGIALELTRYDADGVDAMLRKTVRINGDMPYDSCASVQLKSTSSEGQYTIGAHDITYKLKVKNYNDLCRPASTPSILALLILPKEKEEWVKWSKDELMLGGRMYWLRFQDCELSNNVGSVSVKIPKVNVLNDKTIGELLEKLAEEAVL